MKKFVFAFGALLLVVTFAAAFIVWRYPMAVFNWSNRRALKSAGFEKLFVDTEAGKQAVWVAGSGPETIILLHGLGDHAGSWSKIAPDLKTRYRVVVPDLAGHGDSAPQQGPLSVGTVLAALNGIVEAESPKKPVILVGNSLGAWVAMLYADKHPDRVERIVAVNGGAIKGDRPEYSHLPETREDARKMFEAVVDPGTPKPADFVLDDIVRQAKTGPMARMVQTAPEMGNYLLDDRLAEIKTPVDLLWGESDQLVPLSYARRMEAGLRSVRLTAIPRCGHVPQQECPNTFSRALRVILDAGPAAPKQTNHTDSETSK